MSQNPNDRVHWLHRDYAMKFDLLCKAAIFGAALMYVAMRPRGRRST